MFKKRNKDFGVSYEVKYGQLYLLSVDFPLFICFFIYFKLVHTYMVAYNHTK